VGTVKYFQPVVARHQIVWINNSLLLPFKQFVDELAGFILAYGIQDLTLLIEQALEVRQHLKDGGSTGKPKKYQLH
jgi:hypothetical protein